MPCAENRISIHYIGVYRPVSLYRIYYWSICRLCKYFLSPLYWLYLQLFNSPPVTTASNEKEKLYFLLLLSSRSTHRPGPQLYPTQRFSSAVSIVENWLHTRKRAFLTDIFRSCSKPANKFLDCYYVKQNSDCPMDTLRAWIFSVDYQNMVIVSICVHRGLGLRGKFGCFRVTRYWMKTMAHRHHNTV
jgi:hypothetical protein